MAQQSIQKTGKNQLAAMLAPQIFSTELLECLIKLDQPSLKTNAKMDLLLISSELMPAGKPNFLDMVNYPMIRDLSKTHGKKKILACIIVLVKDFCASVNVVRNMDEDQIFESAMMLLDECGNFRMEDYTMMFALAKRGQLVKIMDRIDISVITQILDAYWERRNNAAINHTEKSQNRIDSIGNSMRKDDYLDPLSIKMNKTVDKLAGAFGCLNSGIKEKGISTINHNLKDLPPKG